MGPMGPSRNRNNSNSTTATKQQQAQTLTQTPSSCKLFTSSNPNSVRLQTQQQQHTRYQSPIRGITPPTPGLPIANKRAQRRAKSADIWLNHKPPTDEAVAVKKPLFNATIFFKSIATFFKSIAKFKSPFKKKSIIVVNSCQSQFNELSEQADETEQPDLNTVRQSKRARNVPKTYANDLRR